MKMCAIGTTPSEAIPAAFLSLTLTIGVPYCPIFTPYGIISDINSIIGTAHANIETAHVVIMSRYGKIIFPYGNIGTPHGIIAPPKGKMVGRHAVIGGGNGIVVWTRTYGITGQAGFPANRGNISKEDHPVHHLIR